MSKPFKWSLESIYAFHRITFLRIRRSIWRLKSLDSKLQKDLPELYSLLSHLQKDPISKERNEPAEGPPEQDKHPVETVLAEVLDNLEKEMENVEKLGQKGETFEYREFKEIVQLTGEVENELDHIRDKMLKDLEARFGSEKQYELKSEKKALERTIEKKKEKCKKKLDELIEKLYQSVKGSWKAIKAQKTESMMANSRIISQSQAVDQLLRQMKNSAKEIRAKEEEIHRNGDKLSGIDHLRKFDEKFACLVDLLVHSEHLMHKFSELDVELIYRIEKVFKNLESKAVMEEVKQEISQFHENIKKIEDTMQQDEMGLRVEIHPARR